MLSGPLQHVGHKLGANPLTTIGRARIHVGHIAERVIELVGLGHFGHALNVDVRDNLAVLHGDPVRPALLTQALAQEGGAGLEEAGLVVGRRAGRLFQAEIPAHLRQLVQICLGRHAIDRHCDRLSSDLGSAFAARVCISAQA